MGTAIKHPVPDRVKPSFVIFDILALWRSFLSVRVPGCQKLQMTSCTHMATVGFKGLMPMSAVHLSITWQKLLFIAWSVLLHSCLSFRLSVMLLYRVKMAKQYINLLSPPRWSILVFAELTTRLCEVLTGIWIDEWQSSDTVGSVVCPVKTSSSKWLVTSGAWH